MRAYLFCDSDKCTKGIAKWLMLIILVGFRARVSASVNLATGAYEEHVEDIGLRVMGHWITFGRSYFEGSWRFPTNTALRFHYGEAGSQLTMIEAGDGEFSRADELGSFFSLGTEKIFVLSNGFRRVNAAGQWNEYDSRGRMLRYGDRNGRTVQLVYNEHGQLSGYQDHFTNQVLWIMYTNGLVSSVRDHAGRTVRYDYDGRGNLTNVIDVLGASTVYRYDATNRLIFRKEPAGKELNIVYHADGTVASLLDQHGKGFFYIYNYNASMKEFYVMIRDTSGRVIEQWQDESGRILRRLVNGEVIYTASQDREQISDRSMAEDGGASLTEYDPVLQVPIREVNAAGVVTVYQYDILGNLTNMIERWGTESERVTRYAYDSLGNLLSETIVGDSNTQDMVTSMTYDQMGNVTSITDPEGHTVCYTYDLLGNVLTITDARGGVISNTYDSAYQLVAVWDASGCIQSNTFDAAGRVVRVDHRGGDWQTFEYDMEGRVVRAADALGHDISMVYDELGRLLSETDVLGRTTHYHYDVYNRITYIEQPDGNRIDVEYDPPPASRHDLVQVRRIVHPDMEREFQYDSRGQVTNEVIVAYRTNRVWISKTYDPYGNIIEMRGERWWVTREYDRYGRLVKVDEGHGRCVEYTYDRYDRRVLVKDPRGNVMRVSYDRNGNVRQITWPGEINYVYVRDEIGQTIEELDGKGQRTHVEYNAQGQPVLIRSYAATNLDEAAYLVNLEYDEAGRLAAWTDNYSSGWRHYDILGRMTSEVVRYDSFSLTNRYVYNADGTKRSYIAPDGLTYTYFYNPPGRLSRIHIPNLGDVTIDEERVSRSARLTFPGGMTVERTYTPRGRVGSMVAKDPSGNVILQRSYSFSHRGEIVGITDEKGEHVFAYDGLGQLIGAYQIGLPEETFAYDEAGNRVSTGIGEIWTYGLMNELLSNAEAFFEYDANGNRIRQASDQVECSYEYDTRDQLIAVRGNTGELLAAYTYDALGRRIRKEAGGKTTWYVYSDEGLVAEYDAEGALQRSYVYIPNSIPGVSPLGLKEHGSWYFFLTDHLGGVLKVVRPSGQPAWTAQYTAFGKAHVDPDSTITNNIRWPGQYFDEETGLHYNLFRYYDPDTGRYLTPDSKGLMGDNLYVYAGNAPLHWIDPLGLFCIKTGVSFDAAIAGLLIPKVNLVILKTKMKLKKLGMDFQLPIKLSGQVCRECCREGPRAGQIVWDWEVSASAAVEVKKDFKKAIAGRVGQLLGKEFWYKLTQRGGESELKGAVGLSGRIKTDKCNETTELKACIYAGGGGQASFGLSGYAKENKFARNRITFSGRIEAYLRMGGECCFYCNPDCDVKCNLCFSSQGYIIGEAGLGQIIRYKNNKKETREPEALSVVEKYDLWNFGKEDCLEDF